MATKLFAFNTLAGAARSSTAVLDGDTTAGRFDSGYVASCIKVANSGDYFDTTPYMDGSASQSSIWVNADVYGALGNSNVTWVEFINSSGVVVLRLTVGGGGGNNLLVAQYNGSGYNNTFLGYTAATALRTWAFNVVCGSSGRIDIYLAGSLWNTVAINQTAVNNIAKVRFYNQNGSAAFYSQIQGADYDIRSARLFSNLATGEGTYTNGTGAYTDINELVLDDSTAIGLAASGNKHTFVKGAIIVPTGYQIGSMIVNARGRVSGGVVTDGKMLVRSATTDSASTGRAYNGGYEPRGAAYDNDPATATRWTQAGFNAAEFGLQAA